jgi:hypothetical protein
VLWSINTQIWEICQSMFHFFFHIRPKLSYFRQRILFTQIPFLEMLVHFWFDSEFDCVISS